MEYIHNQNQIAVYGADASLLAEVTFPSVDAHVVNVSHTFVDASLRGQGVAGKLMSELVKELRDTDRKATLTCSYALSWFQKHPQYNDVICQSEYTEQTGDSVS